MAKEKVKARHGNGKGKGTGTRERVEDNSSRTRRGNKEKEKTSSLQAHEASQVHVAKPGDADADIPTDEFWDDFFSDENFQGVSHGPRATIHGS